MERAILKLAADCAQTIESAHRPVSISRLVQEVEAQIGRNLSQAEVCEIKNVLAPLGAPTSCGGLPAGFVSSKPRARIRRRG